MVADSDAVLGTGDKKNPTFLQLIGDVTLYPHDRYVPWTSNIYASVTFGRVGGVLNVFALVHSLLCKANKLFLVTSK